MTNEEYQKLNYYLNKIFLGLMNNDHFFINNLENISLLNDKYVKFYEEHKVEKNYKENKMDFNDVYLLTREIIESINPTYLKQYDQLMESGQLDFSYDNDYHDSHFFYSKNHMENKEVKLININRNFSYDDVTTLVHEFMHYIKGIDKRSTNCYLLNEYISIYFEIYATIYLYNKGIPKEYIDFNSRIKSAYNHARAIFEYEPIFLVFKDFGNIDENSIDLVNKYYFKMTKESFNNVCLKMIKVSEKIEKEYNMDIMYEEDYDEKTLQYRLIKPYSSDYRYLLGTLLAFYSLKHCDINKIIYLNDHLNDEKIANTGIIDLLYDIGIDLNDEEINDKLFNSIEEYINKYGEKVK